MNEPKPKNQNAVALGRLGWGKPRAISPEERLARQARAAHARAAKALKALAQAEGNGQ